MTLGACRRSPPRSRRCRPAAGPKHCQTPPPDGERTGRRAPASAPRPRAVKPSRQTAGAPGRCFPAPPRLLIPQKFQPISFESLLDGPPRPSLRSKRAGLLLLSPSAKSSRRRQNIRVFRAVTVGRRLAGGARSRRGGVQALESKPRAAPSQQKYPSSQRRSERICWVYALLQNLQHLNRLYKHTLSAFRSVGAGLLRSVCAPDVRLELPRRGLRRAVAPHNLKHEFRGRLVSGARAPPTQTRARPLSKSEKRTTMVVLKP